MKCHHCGKIYKSKRFYVLHVAKHVEPSSEKTRIGITKEKTKIKYREVVYVGTADKALSTGAVTGKKYNFLRDNFKMPKPTKIDEKDYPGIMAIKGKGCARKDPSALYMSKLDWNLELEKAKVSNR